jgi:hypothetical protein
MKLFAVALLLFCCVILVVSLAYIIITTRHRERIKILEKDLDPNLYMNDHFGANTLRIGTFFFGVGLGFLVAVLLDEYVLTSIDNPGIYAGTILLFGGISQLIFYKLYAKNLGE